MQSELENETSSSEEEQVYSEGQDSQDSEQERA